VLAFAVALITGGLMVSRFRYVSGKEFDWSRRVPFAVLLLIRSASCWSVPARPEMLFAMFALYGLSGPLAWPGGAYPDAPACDAWPVGPNRLSAMSAARKRRSSLSSA
jgi:phosphatidylserine synthase